MVTKVSGLVLGNAQVHYNHLNSDVFGPAAGLVVEGNTQLVVTTSGDLSGGGTITLGSGGAVNISYNEPTDVSHFNNDASYIASGDAISLLLNDAGYVVTGSNVSVFNNDAAYVASGDNISVFNNDLDFVSNGENISVFVNDLGYLTSFTETDPVFVASPAYGITGVNITNWNTAYNWGNHALVGYLTSFTETDPVFVASPAYGITGVNITNWNTAYNWGNHALSGYVTNISGFDTGDLSEGTNLYFTNERVDDRVADLLVAGNNTSIVYDDNAGTITVSTDIGGGYDLSNNTTDDLSEGATNLYYTDARVQAAITGGTGVQISNGVVSIGQDVATTADVTFDNITATTIENIDYMKFDITSGAPSFSEGILFYDNVNKTLAIYNQEPDVTMQIGQEQWIRVYNNSGSTIDNGVPVYISGAGGSGLPTVAVADASTYLSSQSIGLATHSIEDLTYGYVTVSGVVRDIDTSGLTAGQRVHIGVTPGSLVTSAPTYPYYPHEIGICIVSDSTAGSILVAVQAQVFEELRTTGDTRLGGDLFVSGDFTVLGSQTISSVNNLSISNNFMYLNSGDSIGASNTNFTGTGLDDAIFTGHFTGTSTETFYVRIDSIGATDTFEWSLDNFASTESTGVPITGEPQMLQNSIYIDFNAITGHTLGDAWDGIANVSNIDIGLVGNRNTGSSGIGYTHVGLFYDVTDQKWKLFDEYGLEPEGTIDVGDTSYSPATLVADTIEANVDWTYIQNKPDPIITVSLNGDVTGSGNVTLNDLTSGTINITAAVTDDSHNHVISNVDGLQTALDTKVNTSLSITAGTGLTGGGNLTTNRTISHGATSTQPSVNNSGRTYIQDVTLDAFGHVTGLVSATETVVNTDTNYYVTGMSFNTADGVLTATRQGLSNLTVGLDGRYLTVHPTTSTVTNTTNTNGIVLQSMTFDSNGHVQTRTTVDLDGRYYTETESDTRFVNVTGDTMTGTLVAPTFEGALSGNASTATKLLTARTISLSGDVTGSASFDGSSNVSIAATIAANSVALGTDTTGNYTGSVAVSGNGLGLTGVAGEGTTFTVTSNAVSTNSPNTIVFRDASGNFAANLITATSTQARYADLAEKYTVEFDHPVGTVMKVSYEDGYEADPCNSTGFPIGVVSEFPAYLMNESIDGQALALKGRVPVRVIGQVRKGEELYAYHNGCASVEFNGAQIVGIALETNENSAEKLVECVLKL